MPSAITQASRPKWRVEMKLAGASGPWIDVSRDVLATDGVKCRRGIEGGGPNDLVASSGLLNFSLNNSEANSKGLLGYYSPRHVNCRRGFDLGPSVRLVIEHRSRAKTVWTGRVASIEPAAGRYSSRRTRVTAADWMYEAGAHKLSGVATQTNVRADQVIATVVAAMPHQPPGGTILDTGSDVYPYALDTARDETTATTEFSKTARSERGFVFLTADGALRFHNRYARVLDVSNLFTMRGTMRGVLPRRRREDIINKVQAVVHPRAVDASATKVLYNLNTQPFVAPGRSVTIACPYSDPDIQAARVGGTDLRPLVAGADYTVHTAPTGGTDITSSISVSPSTPVGSSRASLTFTNNGTVGGYITLLTIRGRAIYDYEQVVLERQDAASIEAFGEGPVTLDMPYQHDVNLGALAADNVLYLYGGTSDRIESVTFIGNLSDEHMEAALNRDIGDRIGISETVTGLSTQGGSGHAVGYHINGVELEIQPGPVVSCTWALAPADPLPYWRVGMPSRSGLGETTVVGPN